MFENEKFNIIYNKFQNKRMPHAILINTNNITKARKDLGLLLKKMVCPKTFNEKCQNECHLCYQIDNNLIPSICEISPLKMTIDRQQIFDLKEKFLAKPLYLDYNIYIINYCDTLNFKSATTLLKFLEEPEDNILGFYLTEMQEKVLPTIRSRCEIFNIMYECDNNNDEQLDITITNYLQYITKKDNITFIYQDIFSELNYERKDFVNMLKYMLKLFESKLTNKCQNEIVNRFKDREIVKILELIKNTLSDIESNVNIELCILLLSKELRNCYE